MWFKNLQLYRFTRPFEHDADSLEKMPTVKAWLRHAEVAKTMVHDNCDCANEGESMKVLTEENVIAQLQHLRTHPSVASRMANGHRAAPAGRCPTSASGHTGI